MKQMRRTGMWIVVLCAFAVLLAACAPRLQVTASRNRHSPEEERELNRQALENLTSRRIASQARSSEPLAEDQSEVPELPILPVAVLTPPPTAAELGQGSIKRDDLHAFIQNGPHPLLATFWVEPVMDEGLFEGFRIEQVHGADPELRACGLRVGDIVVAVNGRDISRPEGFMEVWDSLWDADHLNVDIVRQNQPRSLRWRIQ